MIKSRRLNLESLEHRICLDGNVAVSVEQIPGYEGRTAVFLGDHLANTVQIIQTDTNDYTALGIGFNDFDTTINGADRIQLTNIKNFFFDLGGGDDFLFINGDPALNAPNEVVVDGVFKFFGREGSDNVLIENTKIRGDFNANLGDGNNFLQWIDSRIVGTTQVKTHEGNDFLGAFRTTFHNEFHISTGGGQDSVWLGSSTNQLEGSRFIGSVDIKTGTGGDNIKIDNSILKNDVSIKTGDGRDSFSSTESRFQSEYDLRVRTGKHADQIELNDIVVRNGSTSINMGDGGDIFRTFRLRDTGEGYSGPFTVFGGRHNDDIEIEDSRLTRDVFIRGNQGDDSIEATGTRIGKSPNSNGNSAVSAFGNGGLSIDGGDGADFSSLADLIISSNTQFNSWANVESERINIENIRVELPDINERIEELLDKLQRLQSLQVTVEVKHITLTDRTFESIGIEFDFDPTENNATLNLNKLPGQKGTFGGSVKVDPAKGLTYVVRNYETESGRFGNFDPGAGLKVGLAILSDLDAFLLIKSQTTKTQRDTGITLRVQPVVKVENDTISLNIDPEPFFSNFTPGLSSNR